MKRVLVLSAHTDDGELGAGGTVAYLVEQGATVNLVAFSKGTASPEEAVSAASVLGVGPDRVKVYRYKTRFFTYYRQGILDTMILLRDQLRPDVVFCPSRNDQHQDHEVIAAEAWRAFRNHATILGYELPWSCPSFDAQMLVPLEGEHIARKGVAVRRYKSQGAKSYTTHQSVLSLARVRGMQAGQGCEYAEAFEVIRMRGIL